jgi:hypothetical protein
VGGDEFAYQKEAEEYYMRNTWKSDGGKTAVAR